MKTLLLDAAGCNDGRDFLDMFPTRWRRTLSHAWIASQIDGIYATAIQTESRFYLVVFRRLGCQTVLTWLTSTDGTFTEWLNRPLRPV